jgi:hypothetical protein
VTRGCPSRTVEHPFPRSRGDVPSIGLDAGALIVHAPGLQSGACSGHLRGGTAKWQWARSAICGSSKLGGPRAAALSGREGGPSRWLDPGGRCLPARPVEQSRQRCPGRQQTWRSSCTRPPVFFLSKSAIVVRLVQAHVHPSAVLLVPCLVGIPGALLQELIGDLVVNVLLLEHVLVRELCAHGRPKISSRVRAGSLVLSPFGGTHRG